MRPSTAPARDPSNQAFSFGVGKTGPASIPGNDASAGPNNPPLFIFGVQPKLSTFSSFSQPTGSEKDGKPDWRPACINLSKTNSGPLGFSLSSSSTLTNSAEVSDSEDVVVDKSGRSAFGTTNPISAVLPADRSNSPKEPETKPASVMNWESDRLYHSLLLFGNSQEPAADRARSARLEEVRTSPLFSANVLRATSQIATSSEAPDVLPQYGLLAGAESIHLSGSANTDQDNSTYDMGDDHRLFLNTNSPWSAFVCGSQGSGKSHTLSCMLEAALLRTPNPNSLGPLPSPLAGMVFHYDKFATQPCEAAYLCSTGIPVKVLVSPASYERMKRIYSNLQGVPESCRPIVRPMMFDQKHLNASRMMKLMAVEGADGTRPLYMEVVCRLLRQIAMASQGQQGFDFNYFQHRLGIEFFNDAQKAMLDTRLDLLKDFMQPQISFEAAQGTMAKPYFRGDMEGKKQEREWHNKEHQRRQAAMAMGDTWSFKAGSLTIVDLSCPFLNEQTACDLFDMCLSIFQETRVNVGRIVALDEAHKFLTDTAAATVFQDSLLSVIRLQRHLATRVVIATQEPTISPRLLDLCSMTIVHRFTSPAWLQALKSHLAGVSPFEENDRGRDMKKIFNKIVNLEAGEALLFSPSTMLRLKEGESAGATALETQKLGMGYLKMRVRNRLTADGGRSIMAT